jgi:Zn-dependent protease
MLIDLLINSPILFVPIFAALVTAITVHEFAHAFAADKLGDPTPRLMGRLTVNPLKHMDPFGTLLMLFLNFGWGRPVVFDPYNLKNPRRDTAIISFAGPLSNLLLASVLSIILKIMAGAGIGGLFAIVAPLFIKFNVTLAIFNLIPVHPLDGGKILVGLLPPHEARVVDRIMTQYGLLILLFILVVPVFGGTTFVNAILTPIVNALMKVYMPGMQYI